MSGAFGMPTPLEASDVESRERLEAELLPPEE
jgi:hypothetical protein